MQVLIDQNYLPATLTTGPLTDEQFAELCAEHEDLRFEMTAEGELIVQPMPYNMTAKRELRLFRQLESWVEADGRGLLKRTQRGVPSAERRPPGTRRGLDTQEPRGFSSARHIG
jgi:Uma2 family endonuclease